jgi:uncharacterized protein (DUF2147 family)
MTLAFSCLSYAHNTTPAPTGFWQTLSSDDGKPSSIVHITEVNGELEGAIVKTYPRPDQTTPLICKQCPAPFEDKPILGLRIIWGLKPHGAKRWDHGSLLSPKNKAVYDCSLTVINQDTIDVRGSVNSFMGQTKTWRRSEDPSVKK